jgi:pyruvate,water dikinase
VITYYWVVGEAHFSSEEDFGKVNNGDIVVVYRSSPAWAVPLMRGAGGMICEVGGKVSHIAIICRELGIPCVIGIHGIFEELKDGDLVTVDCENGEVHKHG